MPAPPPPVWLTAPPPQTQTERDPTQGPGLAEDRLTNESVVDGLSLTHVSEAVGGHLSGSLPKGNRRVQSPRTSAATSGPSPRHLPEHTQTSRSDPKREGWGPQTRSQNSTRSLTPDLPVLSQSCFTGTGSGVSPLPTVRSRVPPLPGLPLPSDTPCAGRVSLTRAKPYKRRGDRKRDTNISQEKYFYPSPVRVTE